MDGLRLKGDLLAGLSWLLPALSFRSDNAFVSEPIRLKADVRPLSLFVLLRSGLSCVVLMLLSSSVCAFFSASALVREPIRLKSDILPLSFVPLRLKIDILLLSFVALRLRREILPPL